MNRVHIVLEEVAALRTIISEIQKKQNNKDDSKSSEQIDNINDFLGKQQSWLKEKFRACSTGALNHSTVETHLKDYPGLRMAVSTFSSVTQSNINMDEYMAKYTEWVKGGLAHACNEAVNISSLMNPRQYKEYHLTPPLSKTLHIESSMPQIKKEFRLVNKSNNEFLLGGLVNPASMHQYERYPKDSDIWTLEPVD